MKKNQLLVQLNGEEVGVINQTAAGKMTFSYNLSTTKIISLAMPIREEPYDELQTEAYFGGLLPESELVKKIIGKRYGISHTNNFALLKAIGYDCPGAISCTAPDQPFESRKRYSLDAKILTEDELYTHIVELPQKPLFMDDKDGLRLSLAGAQDKAGVCVVENQIALAENGCPTTHILKPSSAHFEGMAENEYFCLKIAKRIGLPVPAIQLRKIKDTSFLLIERYDRQIKGRQIERIHQEDFCQALGVVSTKKYQSEGGPGFKGCFDLLMKASNPAIDRNYLASAIIFNYLIGNMDAHGKNFSLLHDEESHIRLSPFYDLLCTRVYPNLTSKMAMKIGSKYDADNVFLRHWEMLCNEVNYRYLSMKKQLKSYGELILKIANEERIILMEQDQHSPVIDKMIKIFEKNIARITTQVDA